jgi:hypothetical protein
VLHATPKFFYATLEPIGTQDAIPEHGRRAVRVLAV